MSDLLNPRFMLLPVSQMRKRSKIFCTYSNNSPIVDWIYGSTGLQDSMDHWVQQRHLVYQDHLVGRTQWDHRINEVSGATGSNETTSHWVHDNTGFSGTKLGSVAPLDLTFMEPLNLMVSMGPMEPPGSMESSGPVKTVDPRKVQGNH